jgi:AraC-like DNA-binding protein/tetratricopeptide (TPR) repeat protein
VFELDFWLISAIFFSQVFHIFVTLPALKYFRMKKVLYIIIYALLLPLLATAYGCGPKEEKGTAGSVLTVPYIVNIGITEPERALALIDTAEQQGVMDDFELNRLRAMVYHNGLSDNNKSLEYALKAYDSPSARGDGRKYLLLIEMIADQYYLIGDYARSVEFCTKGIKVARDSVLRSSEANLNFTLGRNLLVLNREDEGFRHYYKAADILDEESEKDNTYRTNDDYIYTLAILIGTLRNEGHYDKAAGLLPRYEDAVRRLETKEQIPDGLLDMRRASGYGMAAHLYAINGEKNKAHEQYLKLCETDYAKTPDGGQLIVPYLYEIGDYRGALHHLRAEKEYWQANTDTVSYSYIQNHLESELALHEKLDDIRSANRVLHTIQMLNDTLRARDSHEKALELAEIYKTNEQALEIERQSASIRIRNTVIMTGAIFTVLGILFVVRILRFNRTISAKNRSMVKIIDELVGYKSKAFELQEEIIRLQEKAAGDTATPVCCTAASVEEAAPAVPPTDAAETFSDDTGVPSSPDRNMAVVELTESESDFRFFEYLDHEVVARQLFLKPDFSKEFLLAEFSIPVNKFSTLFKVYAGCSFSQYIHNCRLDYAVNLMTKNPSWSMDAIAQAAQMSNGSFYAQFKKKFGMSPSEYRKMRI